MATITAPPVSGGGKTAFTPSGDPLEDAILWARLVGITEVERSQALVDGVLLACEQVQDVRLALLEAPQSVTAGELVLDAFFTFFVSSTYSAPFIKGATQLVLGSLVNWAALLVDGPESRNFDPRRAVDNTATSEREIALLARILRVISNTDPRNWSAALRASREVATKRTAPFQLSTSDTAGVKLLDMALSRHEALRSLCERGVSFTEAWLRAERLKPDAVRKQHPWPADVPVDQLRDESRLRAEAIIWAGTLRRSPAGEFPMGRILAELASGEERISDINPKILRYLVERLDPLLKEYAASYRTSSIVPNPLGSGKGGWDELKSIGPSASLLIREKWLLAYLGDLRDEWLNAARRFVSLQ